MKYQHNYTNPEQAKRLRDAGVPAESADCMLTRSEADYGTDALVTLISGSGEPGENWDYFQDEDAFPCWSLGRLIELATFLKAQSSLNKYHDYFGIKITHDTDMVENFVNWFEFMANDFDYSILLPESKPEEKKVQKTSENCVIRYFGSACPLDKGMSADIYNCTDCDHFFAAASKSIICRKIM